MRTAYLISVGNELLCGRTVDTNAAWLSGRLFEEGVLTVGVQMVPDQIDAIVQAFQTACQKADIVIATGGLGPTDDDLTREALAAFLNTELLFSPEAAEKIQAYFRQRGLEMPAANRKQACIPKGAELLANQRGTAPGVLYQQKNRLIILLPGVPNEMKAMFDQSALPRLRQLPSEHILRSLNIRCFGAGESAIAEKLGNRIERGRNPLVNITVSEGIINLQIVAQAKTAEHAEMMVEAERLTIEQRLEGLVFGYGQDTLQSVVGRLLLERGKRLAVAESCTGGLVCKLITDVPGASHYFQRGWVVYSNSAKIDELGVPALALEQYGSVSEPVAKAMAQGAAERAGCECALGITGIAGPDGGTPQKPVGLVYIAAVVDGQCVARECRFPNVGRESIRMRAAQTALNCLRLALLA